MAGATRQDDGMGEDLRYLDTRFYLDRTVVPLLMQGLSIIAKERFVKEFVFFMTIQAC